MWFWGYDLVKWVFIPIASLAILRKLTQLRARDYGLSADLGATDILYVLPLPLFSLFAIDLISFHLSNRFFGFPEPGFSYATALTALGSLWVVGTFYLAVTAGLWESIFFIGLPLLWLGRGQSMRKPLLVVFAIGSALLFAFGHRSAGSPAVVSVFLFQLLAVWWYVRLNTLWPVIGAHFLIDVYYFWPPAKI